jgi:hypothetical protein
MFSRYQTLPLPALFGIVAVPRTITPFAAAPRLRPVIIAALKAEFP